MFVIFDQSLIEHLKYKKAFVLQSDPTELLETAKLALAKGELDIAESSLGKAILTNMVDKPYERNPEPYLYLAEVLQKRAEDDKLGLERRERFLLQAAALYNFVRNYLETVKDDNELSKKFTKIVSRKLNDIQDNMITMCGGNPLQSKFDAKLELKNIREEVKESLESIEHHCTWSKNQGALSSCEVQRMLNEQTEEITTLSHKISVRMKHFFASIINECLEILGTPPCDYEVIVFGSLARNETTPYSDFEWAILTNSEEEEYKVFFRNLTNLVHLQVGEV